MATPGAVGAAIVRAAVRHDIGHRVEDDRRDHGPQLALDLDDSTDSAHGSHHVSGLTPQVEGSESIPRPWPGDPR